MKMIIIGVVLAIGCSGLAAAQSVVNSLSPAPAPTTQPEAGRKPVTSYEPFTPPAADVPPYVSPNQDQVAKGLEFLPNETNEAYTERMKEKHAAAEKEMARVAAAHLAQMRKLAQRQSR